MKDAAVLFFDQANEICNKVLTNKPNVKVWQAGTLSKEPDSVVNSSPIVLPQAGRRRRRWFLLRRPAVDGGASALRLAPLSRAKAQLSYEGNDEVILDIGVPPCRDIRPTPTSRLLEGLDFGLLSLVALLDKARFAGRNICVARFHVCSCEAFRTFYSEYFISGPVFRHQHVSYSNMRSYALVH